jgi:hypothetical protein
MTTADDRWGDIWALVPGEHVHLDELLDPCPRPGSPDWIPLLEQLVERLVENGGSWTVTMDVGVALRVPASSTEVPDAFDHADRAPASEPPAVYRLAPTLVPNIWEGQDHSWTRVLGPGLTQILSFSRSLSEPPDDGGFLAQIVYEVRHPLP